MMIPSRRKLPSTTSDRLSVKLKYSYAEATTGTTTTVPYSQQWSINSAYDPDITNTGGQPLGYDQWAAMYRRYVVTFAKIKLEIVPYTTNDDGNERDCPFWCLIIPRPDNDSMASPPVATLREQPYAKFFAGNRYKPRTIVKHAISMAKLYGVSKKTITTDENFSALTTADPTREGQFYVRISPAFDLGVGVTYQYAIYTEITYYVTFYDRVLLSAS